MNKKTPKLVQIHNHYSIFRDADSIIEGEITVEEQTKALKRFIRWHERQAHLGRQMLAGVEKPVEEPVEQTSA